MNFDNRFINNVSTDLAANRPIRLKLPQWGRIHIDRKLPFLCLYRRPAKRPDIGTERLLLGQASYILIREQDADNAGFRALVKAIITSLSAEFGNALLFEFWSEETSADKTSDAEKLQERPARFAIRADKHRVPSAMLEELESALLAIPEARVSLDYCTQGHPDLMPALLSYDEFSQTGCHWVGLGLTPVYRQDGQVLPFVLRQLHHQLTHALQRGFYTFTHQHTKHRPAHFYELGSRFMTRAVGNTDKQLATIQSQFDLLLHVTPVNTDEAWAAFQDSGFIRPPAFRYRARTIDPDLLKRRLYAIPIEEVEDPTIGHIFRRQRDEIDRQLTMISDRNEKNFLYGSLQVYGDVEPWLLALARRILTEIPAKPPSTKKTYLSAEEFAVRAKSLVAGYQTQAAAFQGRVEIREDVPGVMVSSGNLLIGKQSLFSTDGVEGALAHEVGTHMVTYFNGRQQPFQQFCTGMANYEPLQEGLAVLAEYLVGELKPSRVRTLAARVIAVHSVIDGADFIETFRLLQSGFNISPYMAYDITMRTLRGGGFTKDAIYLKGLAHLLDYLSREGDLDLLYLGKIAQEDIPFVEELKWRTVLKESLLIPHFLPTEQGQSRLKKARQGVSLIDLIKEQ